jgi:hypothetical protein
MSLIIDQTKSKFFMNKTTNETQKPITDDINDMKQFYMVVRLEKDLVNRDVHGSYDDYEEACDNAARLAELNPHHSGGFAVVKAVAIYKADVKVNATILK